MAEAPIMPLYTDAWLADTAKLSAEEKGAYMGLLISMWRSPEPRLRLDHERLARIACVSARRWAKIWPVLAEFFTEDDGFITQKRLVGERLRVSRQIELARTNGRLGGRPKSLKTAETENPDVNSGLSQTEPGKNLTMNHNHKPEEVSKIPFPAPGRRDDETNPRALGTNLRATGNNPRATGTNPRATKTRLPDNFPDEQCLTAARDYWLGKGRQDLRVSDIASEFVSYCKANGKSYVDWPAAWQTWYVRAVQYNRPVLVNGGRASPDNINSVFDNIPEPRAIR